MKKYYKHPEYETLCYKVENNILTTVTNFNEVRKAIETTNVEAIVEGVKDYPEIDSNEFNEALRKTLSEILAR